MSDGLTRALRAVCAAAGWEWCDDHEQPRWDGESSCRAQHAPELPRGAFVCLDHGRVHTPDEQAWNCVGEDEA